MSNNPLLQSVIAPFFVVLIWLIIVPFLSREKAESLVGISIIAGFALAYVLTLGMPAFPPLTSDQKVLYLAGLAGVLGCFSRHSQRFKWRYFLVFLAIAGTLPIFLGWQILRNWDVVGVFSVGVLWIIGYLVLARLFIDNNYHLRAPIALLIAALTGAGVAILGSSVSTGQLYAALSAAIGGYCLWNWPQPRVRFGLASILGGATIFIGLSITAVLYSDINWGSMACVLSTFGVGFLWQKYPILRVVRSKRWEPIFFGTLCVLPGGIGLLIAWWESVQNATQNYY